MNQSEGDGVSPKVVALNVRWLVIIGVFGRRWHVAKNFWARSPEWARILAELCKYRFFKDMFSKKGESL